MLFRPIYNFFYEKVQSLSYSFSFINLIFIILRNDISKFDDDNLESLKDKVITNGPISLKFMQWYLTKITMNNHNGEYNNIIRKFDHIFDNCPFHSKNESIQMFKDDFDIDISKVVNLNSLVEVGSGSIGQVYKSTLIDGREVAIKIKHPNINTITGGQLYIINTLILLQKISFFKNLLSLHVDIEDFMDNLLLQLDFTNEVFNTLKFKNFFNNNKLIVIPSVLYYSNDIIISEYISGKDYDDLPVYQKSKVGLNFYCMILKMNLFLDFTHGDLHKKNWQVRKIEDSKDYQIILYDFGIVFSSCMVEKNRLLWHAFETNNTEEVLKCLPYMLVNDSKEIPILNDTIKDDINELFSKKYNCGVIVENLIKILGKNKLYINKVFLNTLISMTLIEKIFVDIDFINKSDPPNIEKRLRNIASRYGDVYAFCKQYPFYKDLEDYVGKHYNNYQIDDMFVNYNSKLEFDDPLDLEL